MGSCNGLVPSVTTPLYELMLTYQLDTREYISMKMYSKLKSLFLKKMHLKCCLLNVNHFVLPSIYVCESCSKNNTSDLWNMIYCDSLMSTVAQKTSHWQSRALLSQTRRVMLKLYGKITVKGLKLQRMISTVVMFRVALTYQYLECSTLIYSMIKLSKIKWTTGIDIITCKSSF